ncbi:MAG: hypothetical protein IJF14_03055 [Clostridia bacterium]|nr:hypothetical protein [Clostridia bacterium]
MFSGCSGSLGCSGSTGFSGSVGLSGSVGFPGSTGFSGSAGSSGVTSSAVGLFISSFVEGVISPVVDSFPHAEKSTQRHKTSDKTATIFFIAIFLS